MTATILTILCSDRHYKFYSELTTNLVMTLTTKSSGIKVVLKVVSIVANQFTTVFFTV